MDIDDAMTNAGWLLYWFKFIFIFGWFLLLGRVLCCQVDYCGSIWWFVSKMGLSERNLNGVRFEFDPNSTDKFETQTLHESKKSKRIRCCWMSNAAGKVCNREWISELKSGDSIFCFVLLPRFVRPWTRHIRVAGRFVAPGAGPTSPSSFFLHLFLPLVSGSLLWYCSVFQSRENDTWLDCRGISIGFSRAFLFLY